MANKEFIDFCRKKGVRVESVDPYHVRIHYAGREAVLEYFHDYRLTVEEGYDVLDDLLAYASVIHSGEETDVEAFAQWAVDRDIHNPQVGEEYYRQLDRKRKRQPPYIDNIVAPLIIEARAWKFEHKQARLLQGVLGDDFEKFMEAR